MHQRSQRGEYDFCTASPLFLISICLTARVSDLVFADCGTAIFLFPLTAQPLNTRDRKVPLAIASSFVYRAIARPAKHPGQQETLSRRHSESRRQHRRTRIRTGQTKSRFI